MLVMYLSKGLSALWTTLRNSHLQADLSLQHILDSHFQQLCDQGVFNAYQRRVFHALRKCKTPSLGEHWQACDHCGEVKVHYNSCGNRHCPQCQGVKREQWILQRDHDLFEAAYHHVTFTVPASLRGIFKMNEKELYNLLFESMWFTLSTFAKDPRSRLMAQIGIISILHTWTQRLDYHPHLHCIVPAGGLTVAGKWKYNSAKFLFSVKALSVVFKAKFCQGLVHLYQKGLLKDNRNLAFVQQLKKQQWVVHSKPGFRGKASVLEYLGRYTHRIAISNHRLISLADGLVTFSFRDRRAGDIKRAMSLKVETFLQRFAQHILPKGFVKIRHYGLFSTRVKKEKLALVNHT